MPQVKIRVESVDDASAEQTGAPSAKKDEKGAKTALISLFTQKAISTTKQLVGTYVNNIGIYTGNYVKQDNIQRDLSTLGEIVSIGAAFAVNVYAGIAMVAGSALSAVGDYMVLQKQIEIENQRINYIKERNGNTLEDGSRRR